MSFISSSDFSGSEVRSPRVWLSIGGSQLPCITATVTRKGEGEADTFSAELSVDATAAVGFGYAEWADYQPQDVQILMAENAGDEPTSMVTGEIDVPHIHWSEATVTVSGRDKSASLSEKRRSQQFKNQKSSDIVSTIASDHGLSPSVVDTDGFAGKIYDQDTVHAILNLSDHEVLSRLAEREAYRWYVDGTTLYFEPKGTVSDTFDVVWVPPDGQGQVGYASCTDLETHRNMTAAKPHTVAVRSWHHKDKKHYDGVNESDGVGKSVELEHHHNGRNQDQVDKLSKSRLNDAIRHDCNVVVKMPGDLTVDVRQKLNLTGTGTIFDQLYDIDALTFTCSWQGGLDMELCGKIAKSDRSGSSDTGSTKFSPTAPTPPERPAGVGTNSNVTPVTTPAGSFAAGSA